jgi:hypothetical protein
MGCGAHARAHTVAACRPSKARSRSLLVANVPRFACACPCTCTVVGGFSQSIGVTLGTLLCYGDWMPLPAAPSINEVDAFDRPNQPLPKPASQPASQPIKQSIDLSGQSFNPVHRSIDRSNEAITSQYLNQSSASLAEEQTDQRLTTTTPAAAPKAEGSFLLPAVRLPEIVCIGVAE